MQRGKTVHRALCTQNGRLAQKRLADRDQLAPEKVKEYPQDNGEAGGGFSGEKGRVQRCLSLWLFSPP